MDEDEDEDLPPKHSFFRLDRLNEFIYTSLNSYHLADYLSLMNE